MHAPNSSVNFTRGYGAILTALASLLVYAAALANGFAFDDVVLIARDPRVTEGQFGALLTQTYWRDAALGLYRPLTSLSFGLDWLVSNGSAAWFHFINVIWHVLASVLGYALLLRLFTPAGALAGALVFALHPVHVEAVANVVGRSELIAAAFIFAACLAWTEASLTAWTRGILTGICYALAMAAKESAVVLPALLLILELAVNRTLRADARRRARELTPIVLAFVVFMVLRFAVVGGLAPARVDPSLEVVASPFERVVTAFQAWPHYARLLFFPRTLLSDYGPRVVLPSSEWTSLSTIGLTIFMASVIGGIVAFARREFLWGMGLLWFPIAILPVSNFLFATGVVVAERTLYVPSFALSVAVAGACDWLTPARRRTLALVLGIGLLLFALRTMTRVPEWRSTESVMQALSRDRPDAFRAQWHWARMARAQGRPAEALQRYREAIRLWPHRQALVEEAAVFASSQGEAAWSYELAHRGVQRWPHNVNFHRLVGGYMLDHGDVEGARAALTHALQLHPGDTLLNRMWQSITPPAQ